MQYDEFLQRYRAAREKIIADYQSLTPDQRRSAVSRSARIKEIRGAYFQVRGLGAGAISLERLGLTADEAREVAADGRVVCSPDRHRHLVGAYPRNPADRR